MSDHILLLVAPLMCGLLWLLHACVSFFAFLTTFSSFTYSILLDLLSHISFVFLGEGGGQKERDWMSSSAGSCEIAQFGTWRTDKCYKFNSAWPPESQKESGFDALKQHNGVLQWSLLSASIGHVFILLWCTLERTTNRSIAQFL